MRRIALVGAAICALLAPAAPAVADNHPILTSGMQHKAVKRVQKVLKVTPRSGYFGPVTLKAVKKYQRRHAIPNTGVVGPLTWASLDSLASEKKAKKQQAAKRAKKAERKAKRAKRAERQAKRAKKAARTNSLAAGTLQIGDRGAAVLFLQQELGVQPQSGYFGPITQSFVRALQSAAGLSVTGVVDPKTWRKVGKVTFVPPAAPAPVPAPVSTTLPAPSSATAAKVLSVAASQAGVPYVAGGYSPEQGFNCSSYTQWVYKQVGIDLGGAYTVWQYDKSRKISAAEAKPGDLVFFYNYKDNFIGHVGIYAGNQMMWHAPRTGRVVSLERVYTDKVYYGRVLNQ